MKIETNICDNILKYRKENPNLSLVYLSFILVVIAVFIQSSIYEVILITAFFIFVSAIILAIDKDNEKDKRIEIMEKELSVLKKSLRKSILNANGNK